MVKFGVPLLAKMRKKTLSVKARQRVNNVARSERRARALQSHNKQRGLYEDVLAIWRREDEDVEALALKHGKMVRWMKQKVRRTTKYGRDEREVSAYNAWLHCKSLEINENVPPGEKVRLTQLRDAAMAYSGETYDTILKEDLEAMKECLRERHKLNLKGIRSQAISSSHDHRQTSRRIADELKNLQSRCESSSLLISSRTTANQNYIPQFSVDQIARDFIEICLAIPFKTFMLRFEGFALSGVKGQGMNAAERQKMWKKALRTYVQEGLYTITRDRAAKMSWVNYERLVVDKYQVVLEGWPCDSMDPNKLTVGTLEIAVETLQKETCKWRVIGDAELAERRTTVVVERKTRKRRSDEGTTRSTYNGKKTKSTAAPDVIPSDTDDSGSD